MRLRLVVVIISSLFFLGIADVYSEPVQDVLIPIKKISSMQSAFDSPSADWVFTGAVKNEEGENYHYYLQILRHFKQIHALALLVNTKNNQVILFEQSQSMLDSKDIQPLVLNVGQTFLRFNSINNSWVFGSRSAKDKSGFNFKVDMLGKLDEANTKQQELRSGSSLLVGQTGSLNGHISLQGNDSFVTADKAWFRQTWAINSTDNSVDKKQTSPFTTVFCDFEDGTGFYAMHLHTQDALRGSVAEWRDAMGSSQPISQFVLAKKSKDGIWQIQVPFPRLQLSLKKNFVTQDPENNSEQLSLSAGSVRGKNSGFCSISEHALD